MINVNNLVENNKNIKYGTFLKKDIDNFDLLLRFFPSKTMFINAVGLNRPFNQRQHDRFSLSYEKTVYENFTHLNSNEGRGICSDNDLFKIWINFIKFLKSSKYKKFLIKYNFYNKILMF